VTASTLYLEHFQLHRAPFDQEPDTAAFFPAAGRDTVLKYLMADIVDGKPFIKLTGSEGTGKTLMCRLLEQSLDQQRFRLVCLEHPIGSYRDLLRTVCLALGTVEERGEDEDVEAPDYVALFREHFRRIDAQGKGLLLLIDEAENLFLATLERLLRLLCNDEERGNLQVLLVGRLDLDGNLEQLATYCGDLDIRSGYTLEPLSPEETGEYLRFRLRLAGVPGDKHLELFSDGAVDAIYQAAMGNVSMTNSLAEQGMKKACAQGMFRVDEEMIEVQGSLEENVTDAFSLGYDFLRDNKWWLLAGTLAVWLVLVFIWPDGEKPETGSDGEQKLEIITPAQDIVAPPEPENRQPLEAVSAVPEVREIEERPAEEKKEPEVAGPVPAMEPVADQAVDQAVEPAEEPAVEPAVKPAVEPAVEPAERKPNIVVEKKPLVVAPDKRKIVVSPPPVPEVKEKATPRDGDALFNERVKASSTWLAWAYRGGYTIQLMVLASDTAEENLKTILVDDRYYEIRDMLYILRKRSPYAIYLFYGNFPSMDEARAVRNRMPPFLRETQPYVLSIKDALRKIEE